MRVSAASLTAAVVNSASNRARPVCAVEDLSIHFSLCTVFQAKVKVKKSMKRPDRGHILQVPEPQLYCKIDGSFPFRSSRVCCEAPEAYEICLSIPIFGKLGVQVEWRKGAGAKFCVGTVWGKVRSMAQRHGRRRKRRRKTKSLMASVLRTGCFHLPTVLLH